MKYILISLLTMFFIGCKAQKAKPNDMDTIDWKHSEKETFYKGIRIINYRDMYMGNVEFVNDGGKTIIRQGSPFIGFSYVWIAATAKFITQKERSLPSLSKTHKLGKLNVFWSDEKLNLSELNK